MSMGSRTSGLLLYLLPHVLVNLSGNIQLIISNSSKMAQSFLFVLSLYDYSLVIPILFPFSFLLESVHKGMYKYVKDILLYVHRMPMRIGSFDCFNCPKWTNTPANISQGLKP